MQPSTTAGWLISRDSTTIIEFFFWKRQESGVGSVTTPSTTIAAAEQALQIWQNPMLVLKNLIDLS